MNDLITDLRRHYEKLEKDREVLNTTLLKLRELIELNEKNREDVLKQPSQPAQSIRQPVPADLSSTAAAAIPPPLTTARENLEKARRNLPNGNSLQSYNPNTNWQKKILYVLNLLGKPATAKEIAQKIKELEPDSQQSVDKSVELTTSRMNKAGEIAAQKEGVKNYYSLKIIM
ncbi:MAG: hypothetical protein JWQ38_3441 [Flavipsychrobacter sp.]|nr:hypothetical protein [Flavipsychrobacter sp.]